MWRGGGGGGGGGGAGRCVLSVVTGCADCKECVCVCVGGCFL